MKLRWIYLGLVVALTVTSLVLMGQGSTEVAGHALFHLSFAATIMAVIWFIPRPVSTPNRWLWMSGWAVSAVWFLDAIGAFGYDDPTWSAVPGVRAFHLSVVPLLLVLSLVAFIGSACAVAWANLPRLAGVAVAILVAGGGILLVATMVGLAP